MNRFRADLHVHSRFSRATSGKLNVRHLAAWSMVKGLSVMSTGDITHPAWRDELRRDLVFDENSGLYRVREPVAVDVEIPGFVRPAGGQEPLFLLQAEISSIYKKNGVVHKVHNLVYLPDLDSADRLSARLAALGNITSDGRPILGLDSERLLEMVLETSERGVLIPAHIWTPWFSLFGSKSGFDALEDCFGALSSHIFALETGLSSDPAMNRLWSALDNYALVSSSDAHSGENLGREATVFSGTPSYDGLFAALRRAAHGQPVQQDCGFQGTVEFFPEEGKYHLDGHRACNVVLEPEASKKCNNICPVCGKPLTVGVLHRVKALADRETPLLQDGDAGFVSLIPLPEMLGELLAVGPKSRKVQLRQAELVRLFGSELDILHNIPETDLRQFWDALGEAVSRMRRGEVIREGGYDGEYGVVRVFTPTERDELVSGRTRQSLLDTPLEPRKTSERKAKTSAACAPQKTLTPSPKPQVRKAQREAQRKPQKDALLSAPQSLASPVAPAAFPYTEAQQRALQAGPHPVLVLAGPGAGKTRTLVGRIVRLVRDGVPVERILAVTFTRRAATELCARLKLALTPGISASETALPRADTLHALALSQWPTFAGTPFPTVLSEEAARTVFARANAEATPALTSASAKDVKKATSARLRAAWDTLALNRERLTPPEAALAPLLERYTAYKAARNLVDYTDLLEQWLMRLTATPKTHAGEAGGTGETGETDTLRLWTEILVDEIQDFSPLQLALVAALLPAADVDAPDLEPFHVEKALLTQARQPLQSGVDFGERAVFPQNDALKHGVLQKQQALRPAGRGFFGIGDPDQAIYGFRGAHPDVRCALAAVWPTLETVTLSASHRSAAAILTSASQLLGPAAACGQLVATRNVAASLHLFSAPDARHEATWIADQIALLLGGTSHTLEDNRRPSPLPTACSPGDIAVLVRLKALIPVLKAALEHRGIPCAVPQAAPFWDDPTVAALLAGARERGNIPDAIWSAGPVAVVAHLEQMAVATQHAGLLHAGLLLPPLFRESAAFAALTRAYTEQGSWEALLDWVLFRQDLDLVRAHAEQVQILTLHAAKGLEFRAVFLPALEEGLLPFFGVEALFQPEATSEQEAESPADEAVDSAEERRLLYVGLTRAQDALFISHAAQRNLYGQSLRLAPSRFLAALPDFFQRSSLVGHTQLSTKQIALF